MSPAIRDCLRARFARPRQPSKFCAAKHELLSESDHLLRAPFAIGLAFLFFDESWIGDHQPIALAMPSAVERRGSALRNNVASSLAFFFLDQSHAADGTIAGFVLMNLLMHHTGIVKFLGHRFLLGGIPFCDSLLLVLHTFHFAHVVVHLPHFRW